MKNLLVAGFLLIGTTHFTQATPSNTLVISQIYGDGGTSGSTYTNDYIEIYNRGLTAVDLSNYSVQYASGTSWTMTLLTPVILQPGQYYLIKEASNGSGGGPITAYDVAGTISLHSNGGKVALVNSTSVLPNGCLSASIIDLVGYGNATCYEGTAATGGTNIASIVRKTGNTDSDNNSTDFIIAPPNPRSSSFTLPISVSNFSVNKNGKGNELYWQLNCTSASITFELQRSGNGVTFGSIYKEIATSARCAAPFVFTDTKPLEINYYRLKITDPDKNISYSKIILMLNNIGNKAALNINPNRVRSGATIQYYSPVPANIQWIISDVEGKVVKKISGSVTQGENNIDLNISWLSPGHYQVRGYSLTGNTVVAKFVKE